MNDRENLIAMLDRAGVIWSEGDGPGKQGDIAFASSIDVNEGRGPKNLGYFMFSTSFFFDGEGALLAMGAWE